MKDYNTKSIKALQLGGMSKRTQQCYTRSVRMLVEHYDKTPDLITEDELKQYFLFRLNVSQWGSNTMRICYSGIKIFLSILMLKSETEAAKLRIMPVKLLSPDRGKRLFGRGAGV